MHPTPRHRRATEKPANSRVPDRAIHESLTGEIRKFQILETRQHRGVGWSSHTTTSPWPGVTRPRCTVRGQHRHHRHRQHSRNSPAPRRRTAQSHHNLALHRSHPTAVRNPWPAPSSTSPPRTGIDAAGHLPRSRAPTPMCRGSVSSRSVSSSENSCTRHRGTGKQRRTHALHESLTGEIRNLEILGTHQHRGVGWSSHTTNSPVNRSHPTAVHNP